MPTHHHALRASAIAALAVGTIVACEHPTAPEATPPPPVFGFGNGAPTGAHYNLNWIGVPQGKTADMTGSNGHVIFVSLVGHTNILLCESGVGTACSTVSGFQVLDANGTDGTASFALPAPVSSASCPTPLDPTTPCTALYSVYVRALGKPGGTAGNTLCGLSVPLPGFAAETLCSVDTLRLTRPKGQQLFTNVTKQMLFVFDTLGRRVPLFDPTLTNFFWSYDNNGLKLAQFRFYLMPTTVTGP